MDVIATAMNLTPKATVGLGSAVVLQERGLIPAYIPEVLGIIAMVVGIVGTILTIIWKRRLTKIQIEAAEIDRENKKNGQ